MTHVLIVDDKEENLYYLKVLLESAGFLVSSAVNGSDALVSALKSVPDVVVSDLLMPVMDGYTLLRHWKVDGRLSKVPFVVYTATYTEEADEQLALDLGADAFLLKPTEPDEFLQKISEVLSGAAIDGPAKPKRSGSAEAEVLREYSATLIRKLEEKTQQLEETNRMLQRDIARREEAEVSLRESEARFRLLADNINEVFWVGDPLTKKILYVSPAFEKIWARSCEELYASTDLWMGTVHPGDLANLERAWHHRLAGEIYEERYRITRPDGSVRWIRDRSFPVLDEQGRLYRMVGTAEDITESCKLEEQFLRAQRMEGIGAIAGGMAHDLNNVLAPILMGVELLKLDELDDRKLKIIETIETNAQRGASLVKQVLSFARGVEGSRAALRVDELVRDVESFARAGFPKDVVLSSHVPSDVWSVAGDPTQLHQVLLNLYVNARDSMPDGGRIDVVVSNCDVNASEAAEMRRMTAGRYVVMEVKDEGMGMGRDVMERIFEPFFTTKEAGKGTGLGLSTVLGIVRSHAGYVQVESEQGKGTKFRVYIPALVEGESEGASGSVVVNGRSLDEGKVLLVDDDEVLLDVTRQMLEVAGYRVVIARDGAEALRIYQQQSESIRAVVTDLLMPSMDGWTLIHALRQVDAGIPIIAISGVGVHEARARQAGADNFLAKPLPITRLLEALRNMAGLPTPQ